MANRWTRRLPLIEIGPRVGGRPGAEAGFDLSMGQRRPSWRWR